MKRKIILGLICAILMLGITTGCGNEQTEDGNGITSSNVDLTIDESVPKYLTCNLVGKASYGKKANYSYEYILPNWNRYTFLKEYEKENWYDPGLYLIDYDKECDEEKVDWTTAKTDDFGIRIHYSIDRYASNAWANIKERTMDNLLYTKAGSPTLYGNDNGYWYVYMDKGKNPETNEEIDELHVQIKKEVAKFEGAITTGGKAIGDEFHALEISIVMSYQNETGKIRLNYLLNDLKAMLTEKYNLDLKELSIDMIKK